ncbi:MAG: hypothetical protein KF745_05765 [Phycisphaeraceae bacterium]|nr:hypothetical protein [Phycisphaeraceae bacterium]
MTAWNGWYHVTGNTYGTWLPGDDRGWKTRHARPQPGADAPIPPEDRSRIRSHVQARMGRKAVSLSPAARSLAAERLAATLATHQVEAVILAVTPHHFHVLARFTDSNPRRWIGLAKKDSARALSSAGLVPLGGVWATRSHCKPIVDREHQLNVARYIANHAQENATVWRLMPSHRSTCRSATPL